jgi:ribosome biogenesis GTPase
MDEDGAEHTLRAQGKLRRERLKPKVGDHVEIAPGEGEEHGWILAIQPRKNELVRPPVANIDVVVIVAAAATPDPDLMMADRLMLNARRAGIDVMLVVNKSDLAPDRAAEIVRAPRIGIDYAGEAAEYPWRFTAKEKNGVPMLEKDGCSVIF